MAIHGVTNDRHPSTRPENALALNRVRAGPKKCIEPCATCLGQRIIEQDADRAKYNCSTLRSWRINGRPKPNGNCGFKNVRSAGDNSERCDGRAGSLSDLGLVSHRLLSLAGTHASPRISNACRTGPGDRVRYRCPGRADRNGGQNIEAAILGCPCRRVGIVCHSFIWRCQLVDWAHFLFALTETNSAK
jgi:hypothetical protein